MASLQEYRQAHPQYDKVPDDQLVNALHQKYYSSMPIDQFHQSIGYAPNPSFASRVGENLLGEGDIAATGALNIPHAAASGITDIYRRLTGGNTDAPLPDWMNALEAHLGQSGKKLAGNIGQIAEDTGVAGAGRAVADKFNSADSFASDLARNSMQVGGDILSATPATALATSAGRGVVRSLASSAVRDTGADAAAASAGFRNGSGAAGTAGKTLAGNTAKPALVNHNADIAAVHARAESGIPHDQPLGYDSFAAGREAPNGVFDRTATNLPTGPLDESARTAVGQAGLPEGGRITAGSPQAQTQIEALRTRLADPNGQFTGQQQVNELRALRQEGFHNSASDDVSNQQLGRAQLDMARAVEGHIGRNLPENGTVSLAQFQDARKALAKNYTWQSALRGNDVDLNALARAQRAEPQLLDGMTETAANFANANREVVGLPTRLQAPNAIKDLEGTLSLLHPVQSTITGLGGGMLGRQILRGGNTLTQVERLQRMFPNQSGRFGALEPRPPQPPPGMTAGPMGSPPPAGGHPGDIPLADLLSHGVEQSPPPGLTSGPMGSPPPQGMPFRVDPGHAAGGLSVAPEDSWFQGGQQPLGDLAAVMSQGVPEGIMARAPAPGPRMPVAHNPAFITNNGSVESAASQEAINRGTRDLVHVDPDGNGSPVLRDSTQIDRTAPKGHLIVDRHSGEIISRGGMNQKGAEGLRNRWASRIKLGDNFTPGE